jgi:hypothetical protein
MVSRDDSVEKIHTYMVSPAHIAIKGAPLCIISTKAIVYMKDVSAAKLICPCFEFLFDTKQDLSYIDRFYTQDRAFSKAMYVGLLNDCSLLLFSA